MDDDAEYLLDQKSPESFQEEICDGRRMQVSSMRFDCCPLLPLAASIAALGGVLFGYDVGIISGAMLQLRKEFNLTCSKQEAVVTSLLIGGLIASIVGGHLVDKFGRRKSIIYNSLIFIVGAVVLALSQTYAILLVGRLFIGFAVSLSAIGECIYIAEIAPPKKRGLLVSLNELGITFGIVLAYLINFLFISKDDGWRWMFGLSVIFGVLQLIGMTLLPASPRWLVSQKKTVEASRVIVALWPQTDPSAEIERLKSSMSVEKRYQLLDLVRSANNMRFRMFIGCGLVFFQQITGQPTVLYYAPAVFQSLGFTSGPAATLATVGLGTVKVFCTILALLLVDKFGRRCFLLAGIVSMTSSLIVLSVITQPLRFEEHKSSCGKPVIASHHNALIQIPRNLTLHRCQNETSVPMNYLEKKANNCSEIAEQFHGNATQHVLATSNSTDGGKAELRSLKFNTLSKYVCLIALMGFVAGYAIGFGPMSWLVLTEIFPVAVKGRAVAIATIFNWGTNIIISSTFLGIIDKIGISWTFAIYAGVASLSVVFVYQFIPETKRRSLEQISAALGERSITCPQNICCHQRRTVTWVNARDTSEGRLIIVREDTL